MAKHLQGLLSRRYCNKLSIVSPKTYDFGAFCRLKSEQNLFSFSTDASVLRKSKPQIQNTKRSKFEKKDEKNQLPSTPLQTAHNYHPHFTSLNLMGPLIKAVNDAQFLNATDIQKIMIKKALKGFNIVASSETGSGKTAAYILPTLQRLHIRLALDKKMNRESPKGPLVLILTPTKELAEQVIQHTKRFATYLEYVKILGIFGGIPDEKQFHYLQEKPHIIVGTPARIVRVMKEHPDLLDISGVQSLIVDECDRILSLGSVPDVLEIRQALPKPSRKSLPSASDPSTRTQIIMMSATLLPEMEDFMLRLSPRNQIINLNKEKRVAKGVNNVVLKVTSRRKFALLLHLLGNAKKDEISLKDQRVLVFTRTQQRAKRLAESLVNAGYVATSLHSELSMSTREHILQCFRENQIQLLIATDVMSRGIDIPNLTAVLSYDVPSFPEDFLHRAGRTGRAGNKGMSITLVGTQPKQLKVGQRVVEINEQHLFGSVLKFLKKEIPFTPLPSTFRDDPEEELESPTPTVSREADRIKEILLKKKTEELKKRVEQKKGFLRKLVISRRMSPEEAREQREQLEEKKEEKIQDVSKLALRNFKEGRYEDVVKDFQAKAARRRGIVPGKLNKKKSKL